MSEKSNDINNLRKRSNMHYSDEMRDYVMELWMQGTSSYAIDRLVRSKISQKWRKKRTQKSA